MSGKVCLLLRPLGVPRSHPFAFLYYRARSPLQPRPPCPSPSPSSAHPALPLVHPQALHASAPFIPALAAALACPHPTLRKPATGLLGCVLFDGAGLASSGSSAAAVDSQRYQIVDGWRQALLGPGLPTVRLLLDTAQDAVTGGVLGRGWCWTAILSFFFVLGPVAGRAQDRTGR